jgi:hypothetical protein
MHQDEFAGFERTLRQLGEAFNRKLTDELVQAYWKALKDLPLSAAQRCADTHMRYGKFFPKPVELRPKDAPAEQKSNPDHDAAVENCIRWNDERMRKDPLATKWRALAALAARASVTERFGSVEYEERMAFLRQACKRLLAESDLAYVGSEPGRIQIIGQLLGGALMDHAIAARKAAENPAKAAA